MDKELATMILGSEAAWVLIAHVVVFLQYFQVAWNMGGFPPSELQDARELFHEAPVQPIMVQEHTLWMCSLRSVLFAAGICALWYYYYTSHKSWLVALFWLLATVAVIEILRRFKKRRYHQDFNMRQAL